MIFLAMVDNQVTITFFKLALQLFLLAIDYPDPPTNLEVVSGPELYSVTLIWDLPPISSLPSTFVSRPRDGFEVWGRSVDSEDYQTLSAVGPNTLRVNVTGLHPGTLYWLVVASINTAGPSLSNVINITTLPACKLYPLL